MKKLLVLLATAAVCATSFAQPMTRHDGPARHDVRPHHKKKVWVPAHREHGHLVRGHYVWR